MKNPEKVPALLAAVLMMTVLAGCSSGNRRLISQVGDEVTAGAYEPADIPGIEEPEGYLLGSGDLLDVNFLYNSQYSRQSIRVRPDGKISYPHAGEIYVAGMSVTHLDSVLTERFSEIVIDPDITVIVKEFQERAIYLLGEVNNPGIVDFRDGMTTTVALAIGEGFSDEARRNNVLVIRRLAEDHVIGVEVDVKRILEGKDLAGDITLRPNDIIYVPRSRIATTEDFIDSVFTILGRPMDLYLKGWQVANADVLYEYYSTRVVVR